MMEKKIFSKIAEIEKVCTKLQFIRMIWGMGQLNILTKHSSFEALTEVFLSAETRNACIS